MIDLSQKLIVSLVFCSFTCGICLGVIYELARFAKYLISPTAKKARGVRLVLVCLATLLTDFLFLVLFAICGILITFEMCGGVFRGVIYVCMAGGILIYRITVGRLTVTMVAWLATAVKVILKKTIGILILPLRGIIFLIVKLYTLTMGKIIGRIKERMIVKRLAGLFLEDADVKSDALPPAEEHCEKGYKKEGRVSFGGKKEF